MTTELPQIERGTRWQDTYARQWKNLTDQVQKLAGASLSDPGGLIHQHDGGGTLRLSVEPPASGQRPDLIRVAMVGPVSVERPTLLVRRVTYPVDRPPTPGILAWGGTVFAAYPEVGLSVADFEDQLYAAPLPTAGMPVLTARRRGRYWFVSLPGAESAPTTLRVAVTAFQPDGLTMLARRVAYDPTVGQYSWGGDQFVAYAEPGRDRAEYEDFLFAGPTPTVDTELLEAVRRDGFWFVRFPDAGAAPRVEVLTVGKVFPTGYPSPDNPHLDRTIECWRPNPDANPGGREGVTVAKPFDLQFVHFLPTRIVRRPDGIGEGYRDDVEYRYSFRNPDRRLAVRWESGAAADEEVQVITPAYAAHVDVILAMRVGEAVTGIQGVQWLDLNVAARAFMREPFVAP